MIDPISFSERLMFSTVQITTIEQAGVGSATGFFFIEPGTEPDTQQIYLVTNRHVMENATRASFIMHIALNGKPSGHHFDAIIVNASQQAIYHPDPNIDLCVISITGFLVDQMSNGMHFFFQGISREVVPTQQQLEALSAIEDVTMMGYPIGLIDRFNNLPIARRGITANHPAIDFNMLPHGVLDIACFRGSSGSPIFVLNEGTYSPKSGGIAFNGRAYFLGVQFAGAQESTDGEIEMRPTPTINTPVPVTKVMVNLAYYVPRIGVDGPTEV